MDTLQLEQMAKRMRRRILDISHACNAAAHVGGGLSIVDITATLYGAILRYDSKNPDWQERDRFILSKGHGVLGYYTALVEAGFISDEILQSFQTNGSDLIAHPVMNLPLGIESSNGSLGQGLSMGVGLALAAKKKTMAHKIYILLGDGECNEGSVWEAAMSAAHYKLDNLTAVVDKNSFQSDGSSAAVMAGGDLEMKWKGFGWDVHVVDGHNISDLYHAFLLPPVDGKPKAIIAQTVKGKGVSFMENNNEWHHNRLTKAHYDQALQELRD